ncbi:hypothetical protein BZA77DRAFT_140977 [Pyronema omphalodes]|nr:hypothetical protein BZA77DRAFT_140977 [Pyronema omphalodes]
MVLVLVRCYGSLLWCYGAMVLWCYGAMVMHGVTGCYGATYTYFAGAKHVILFLPYSLIPFPSFLTPLFPSLIPSLPSFLLFLLPSLLFAYQYTCNIPLYHPYDDTYDSPSSSIFLLIASIICREVQ